MESRKKGRKKNGYRTEYRRIGFQSLAFNAEFIQDTLWSINDFRMKEPFGMLPPLLPPSMKWFKWQLIVYPFKLSQTARVTFCQNNHLANYQFTRKPRPWWLRKLLLTKEKFDSTQCFCFAVIHCDKRTLFSVQQLPNIGIIYEIKLRNKITQDWIVTTD